MTVLIIGLGSIARKHFRALKQLAPSVCVYALRSGNNIINEDGIINIFNINELFVKPDFCIISSPTALHAKHITLALTLNCPLLIEKPVLHSLEHAYVLENECRKKNIITYVACNLRFHKCLGFIKNYLRQNNPVVNEVNIYCGSYLPDWRPGNDYKLNYSSNSEMGGGVHLDLIHEIDYTYWLFGSPKNVTSVKTSKSSLHINSVDYANYILEYDFFNVSISLNYYRRDTKRSMELVLSTDTLMVDLKNHSVKNSKGEILFDCNDEDILYTYKDQLSYFLECIKENVIPDNNINYAINVLKTSLT